MTTPIARDNGVKRVGSKKPAAKKSSSSKSSSSSSKTTTKSSGGKKPKGYKYANRLASAAIHSTVRDLGNKTSAANRAYNNEVSDANQQGQRAVGDLNYLYNESGRYIGNANSKMNADSEAAKKQTTAAGAALQAQIAANGQRNALGVSDQLAGLGIGYDGALGGMNADQNYAAGVANQNTSNSVSNLSMMQSSAQSVGDLLLGMNKGSQTSQIGQARNAQQEAINEAARQRNDQLSAINDSINSAKAGRGDLIVQIMDQMRQSGWFKSSSTAKSGSKSGGSGGSGHRSGGSGGSGGSGFGTHTTATASVLANALGAPTKPKKPKKVKSVKVTAIPINKFDQDGHPGIDY